MDEEWLERLKVDAQNEDHECVGGKSGTLVYTEDLRALLTAYEERGEALANLLGEIDDRVECHLEPDSDTCALIDSHEYEDARAHLTPEKTDG